MHMRTSTLCESLLTQLSRSSEQLERSKFSCHTTQFYHESAFNIFNIQYIYIFNSVTDREIKYLA